MVVGLGILSSCATLKSSISVGGHGEVPIGSAGTLEYSGDVRLECQPSPTQDPHEVSSSMTLKGRFYGTW